jgi:hypothetical protein
MVKWKRMEEGWMGAETNGERWGKMGKEDGSAKPS